MGNGIAHVCAQAGYEVVLTDIDDHSLAAAISKIRTNLDKGIARGKLTESERDS